MLPKDSISSIYLVTSINDVIDMHAQSNFYQQPGLLTTNTSFLPRPQHNKTICSYKKKKKKKKKKKSVR